MDRIPYTYLIGWSAQNLWYYGCRYAKGCDPKDLWVSYFTSSTTKGNKFGVDYYRKLLGEPDVIQIRKVFDNIKTCQIWESRVLRKLNAASRTNFINRCNGLGILDNSGVNNPRYGVTLSEEHKRIISEKNSYKRSEETRHKISESRLKLLSDPSKKHLRDQLKNSMIGKENGMTGKRHSEETKRRISEKNKNKAHAFCSKTKEYVGLISLDDSRWKTGEIISKFSGKSLAKDPKTGEKLGFISKEDPRWKTGEICGIAKKHKEN